MHLRLAVIFIILFSSCHSKVPETKNAIAGGTSDPAIIEWLRFRRSVDSVCAILPSYLRKQNCNQDWVIVAKLSIHSGLPRMALVNIKNKRFADSGCVAHGCGDNTFAETVVFSNKPGSLCSSMGRYQVSTKYKGRFGDSYKLIGLDKTNSNAFARNVVLHSYICVPDSAPYPGYICNSQGCPMVSPNFLNRLSACIDISEKPVLLWVLK